MSSHREAPEISKDPVADSTDLYAFVSPDKASTVTLIANYIPLQDPAGGPNFYQFGDDVQYDINIDNTGDGKANIVYRFTFTDTFKIPSSFLYNDGPITSLSSKSWNRVQTYTVTKSTDGGTTFTAQGGPFTAPPCNIGPLSTPNYSSLADAAVYSLTDGSKVFVGQRAEGFYVDLGSIFDLGTLRPFQNAHNKFGVSAPNLSSATPGINATKNVNVSSLALQVPKSLLGVSGAQPTIGVWTSAHRQSIRMLPNPGPMTAAQVLAAENMNEEAKLAEEKLSGLFVQRSRLGNPLFNEVLVPISLKDFWNTQAPANDSQFAQFAGNPLLAQLLPVLYPNVLPNLAAYNKAHASDAKARPDIIAVLLTGIPSGIVKGFSNTIGSSPAQADMLRLNTSVPPASTPSTLGLLGGDAAGFPNGRRVFDDVTSIELQALAGATLPLVDKSYTADKAATEITQGLTANMHDLHARSTENYLAAFPYLGLPYAGYDVPDNNVPAPSSSY